MARRGDSGWWYVVPAGRIDVVYIDAETDPDNPVEVGRSIGPWAPQGLPPSGGYASWTFTRRGSRYFLVRTADEITVDEVRSISPDKALDLIGRQVDDWPRARIKGR